jgi:hypothetical protein
MPEVAGLGAEFLRWEVATATAGLCSGSTRSTNRNVQQAKDATRALLDVYEQQHRLPTPEPTASVSGARLTVSGRPRAIGRGSRQLTFFSRSVTGTTSACSPTCLPTKRCGPARWRRSVRACRQACGCATMVRLRPALPAFDRAAAQGRRQQWCLRGGGPRIPRRICRFLTSRFSFGVLELAQGLGDFQSLDGTNRRALHVHLPAATPRRCRRCGTHCLGSDLEFAVFFTLWPRRDDGRNALTPGADSRTGARA